MNVHTYVCAHICTQHTHTQAPPLCAHVQAGGVARAAAAAPPRAAAVCRATAGRAAGGQVRPCGVPAGHTQPRGAAEHAPGCTVCPPPEGTQAVDADACQAVHAAALAAFGGFGDAYRSELLPLLRQAESLKAPLDGAQAQLGGRAGRRHDLCPPLSSTLLRPSLLSSVCCPPRASAHVPLHFTSCLGSSPPLAVRVKLNRLHAPPPHTIHDLPPQPTRPSQTPSRSITFTPTSRSCSACCTPCRSGCRRWRPSARGGWTSSRGAACCQPLARIDALGGSSALHAESTQTHAQCSLAHLPPTPLPPIRPR